MTAHGMAMSGFAAIPLAVGFACLDWCMTFFQNQCHCKSCPDSSTSHHRFAICQIRSYTILCPEFVFHLASCFDHIE